MLEYFGPRAPPVRDGDLPAIAAPLDFVGVNNYSRTLVRADPDGGAPLVVRSPTAQLTDMGWEIYPDGLAEVLRRLHEDYGSAVSVRHRERRRVRGRPHPRRASSRQRATRLPGAYIDIGEASDRRTAFPSAATSSGRCSTTSSGRTATRSASASSTSTTRRSNASRRTASTGIAT